VGTPLNSLAGFKKADFIELKAKQIALPSKGMIAVDSGFGGLGFYK
jgi:hypothetical protein